MTNNVELNNKSIDDLRKIALSLGLENSENYNVEDLKEFIERGYKIEKFEIVDQFPRTYHVEAIALIQKM